MTDFKNHPIAFPDSHLAVSPEDPRKEEPQPTFTRADVKRIIAVVDGESDGPDWVCVGKLQDGRFFVASGGCDYTGWD